MSGFRARGRGRGAGVGAGAPPRGQFVDGVWHCDCDPRKPAVHFETKKEGPNKGKWFRTCQKQTTDKGRCKFFLWDSDAHKREAAALSSNSRTEPGSGVPTTPSKRQPSPPPPYSVETIASASTRKRNRTTTDLDDELGYAQADDEFNSELANVMTAIETPSKAVKTSEHATPSTRRKLPWQMDQAATSNGTGLQTPQTDRKVIRDPFNTRTIPSGAVSTPSRRNGMEDGLHPMATPSSSAETPTPARFRNIAPDDLVRDVFEILHVGNVRLSADTHTGLKDLLSKHAKGAEGFKRGRDVIRSTVKAKDAKITELTYRVNTLEAELEAEKAMVKHLQWEAGTQDEDP
ncbi:hypothetical protein BDU57DRAFT_559626 [Ampelomyces quisqualis]|uniref:GRF-type domain-containing protein n=1 Tax=Ampelomyces quisqualis TaxID=50730 RepID=A0A6A5Q9R6_AMPQU|nr:hypothetical protein BDU57DRAFT_559626 [Ampelomyces quisqualis]